MNLSVLGAGHPDLCLPRILVLILKKTLLISTSQRFQIGNKGSLIPPIGDGYRVLCMPEDFNILAEIHLIPCADIDPSTDIMMGQSMKPGLR